MDQNLTITDFKCFNGQVIKFKNLTVFAGSNSVGKSSIIQSLLLSRFVYEGYLNRGNDLIDSSIPLNGPFLLELGNSAEVIRREKRGSTIDIKFSLEQAGNEVMSIVLSGDKTIPHQYELLVKSFSFERKEVALLNKQFYYLSAERFGPRLRYEYEPLPYLHAGFRGERTFQILSGDNIAVDSTKLRDPDESPLLFVQARNWLNYIIPGANFDSAIPLGKSKIIEGTYGDSLPTNVGFGISYVLPIIVNGLVAEKNTVFIIENPEAHLHPLGQSRIGKFLGQIASSGIQVIIETHSEHVINGIRISVLEQGKLSAGEAVINFMSGGDKKEFTISEINFDDEAELNKYPAGFIDQEQRDIAEMVRLIKANKDESQSRS